jgi:hypothetical protein
MVILLNEKLTVSVEFKVKLVDILSPLKDYKC